MIMEMIQTLLLWIACAVFFSIGYAMGYRDATRNSKK